MNFGLYAFKDRFGNWSQPFLAHDEDEAVAMIKEGLRGKQLSYAERGKSLFTIGQYFINYPQPICVDDVVFICDVDKLLEEEKGSVENE